LFFARSFILIVSIVIPVYKSERSINILYNQIRDTLEKQNVLYEVIPVCDASPDDVWQVLEKMASRDQRLKPILLADNAGQQQATLCGIDAALGDFIVTIDDDLEFSPRDIPLMLATIQDSNLDLVYGVAVKKEQKGIKRASAKIARAIIGLFFPRLKHLESFRIFKKEVRTEIDSQKQFVIDFEYSNKNIHIGKCDVSHNKRMFGESNYSMFGSLQVWFTFLFKYTFIPYLALAFILTICLAGLSVILSFILALPLVFWYIKYRFQRAKPYAIKTRLNFLTP
jgi:glycosyltransferase involved in cell wall biosynthesis